MGTGSQSKGLLQVRSFRAACSILRDVYCTRAAGHQGKGKITPGLSLPTQGDTVSWWSSGKSTSQGRWRRSIEFSRGSPHRTMPRLVTGGWSPHIWNYRWLWKPPFFHFLPLQLPLERYSIRQSHFRSSESLGKEEKHLLKIRMMKASPLPSSRPIFLALLVQASGVELQGGCKRRAGFSSQPWLLVSDNSCCRSCSVAGQERLEKPPQTVHIIYLSLAPTPPSLPLHPQQL